MADAGLGGPSVPRLAIAGAPSAPAVRRSSAAASPAPLTTRRSSQADLTPGFPRFAELSGTRDVPASLFTAVTGYAPRRTRLRDAMFNESQRQGKPTELEPALPHYAPAFLELAAQIPTEKDVEFRVKRVLEEEIAPVNDPTRSTETAVPWADLVERAIKREYDMDQRQAQGRSTHDIKPRLDANRMREIEWRLEHDPSLQFAEGNGITGDVESAVLQKVLRHVFDAKKKEMYDVQQMKLATYDKRLDCLSAGPEIRFVKRN